MIIMGNMALLWEGYGNFSDLLIVFRFPGIHLLASGGERTLRQLAGSRRSSVFREFCKETQRCCQLQHLAQDDAFPNRKRAGKTEECIHSTG